MKKIILIAGLVLVMIGGYVAAGPYLTVYAIKNGVVDKDPEKLSENIDFSALRQSVKEQINSQMMQGVTTELKDSPFAALAAGFASKMIDGVVDVIITPNGLAKIMEGDNPDVKKYKNNKSSARSNDTPKKENLFKNARYSYDSLSEFSIYVPNNKGEEATFLLKRQGLSWKLVDIQIPMNKQP